MQGYPSLVYGIRLTDPHEAITECSDQDEAAEALKLPEEFAVQNLDEDYEYAEGPPIIYIKESEKPSDFDKQNDQLKSLRTPETNPEWHDKLLQLAEDLHLHIEAPPDWYAFVTSY